MTTPLRVLLVEDSEDDALLIERALRRGGYDLTLQRVENAEQMRQALTDASWDIVITDYALPRFSGMEALLLLKVTGNNIPIIIVSGTIGEEVAVAAMKAGAYDYVMKDKLARLLPAVERELQDAQVRQARQQAEEQLRKLSRAVEQNPIAVMITDTEGVIEYVNPRFTQQTGYEAADILGKTPALLQSGQTPAAVYAELWHALKVGQEWSGELHNRKQDGTYYWVAASISPIYNQENIITHYLALEEDITARKQAEEEQNQRLERMERQHTTLIQLATHPDLAAGRLPEALRAIATAAAETLQVSRVNIWRATAQQNELRCLESATPDGKANPCMGQTTLLADGAERLAALQSKQILAITDTPTAEHRLTKENQEHIAALIKAPIRLHGQLAGVLTCEQLDTCRAWQPDELTFASQISDLTAQAFLNADLRRRADELAAITGVSSEITSVTNLQEVLASIARHAALLSFSHASGVFGFREDGSLYIIAGYGISEEFRQAVESQGVPLGQGAIGQATAERRAVQIPDITHQPDYPFSLLAQMEQISAVLAVPMLRDNTVSGGIVLWHREPRHYTPQEVAFIQALAQQCVNAVENARLFEAEARRRREAETLRAVTQALSTSLDLNRVLELILSELQKVVPYDSGSVQQLRGDVLEIIGGRGFPNLERIVGLTFDLTSNDNPNQQVIRERRLLIVDDAPKQYKNFCRSPHDESGTRAWLGAPLIFGDRLIGMLSLDKQESHFYTAEHGRLVTAFATQAAIAIENARLFTQEEQRATELAHALEQQQELDRLKDQFIQNVSHELRTPLAIARGYAELLHDHVLGNLQPEQEEPVAIITRRMQMLTQLVEDINAILEVETQKPVHEKVDFARLVAGMINDFQVTAKQAGVTLTATCSPDLPSLLAEPTQMRRLLDNLVGNALKFTPEGGQINVRLTKTDVHLILEVQDTGIGIPADKLERIFERFYQVDGSMSRRYGGTGLGLALVKSIVTAHGGNVKVISQRGVGSTFTVKLPYNETGQ